MERDHTKGLGAAPTVIAAGVGEHAKRLGNLLQEVALGSTRSWDTWEQGGGAVRTGRVC